MATVSSVAALSLTAGAGDAGFRQGFGAAALVALIAAVVGAALVPPRAGGADPR